MAEIERLQAFVDSSDESVLWEMEVRPPIPANASVGVSRAHSCPLGRVGVRLPGQPLDTFRGETLHNLSPMGVWGLNIVRNQINDEAPHDSIDDIILLLELATVLD